MEDNNDQKRRKLKKAQMTRLYYQFDVAKWNINRCISIYQTLMDIQELKHFLDTNVAKLISEYSIETKLKCLQCSDQYSLICPSKWVHQDHNQSSNNNAEMYYSEKDNIYIREQLCQNAWKYEILCLDCACDRQCQYPNCYVLCWWKRNPCFSCNRSFCNKCIDSYIQDVSVNNTTCIRCKSIELWQSEFGDNI